MWIRRVLYIFLYKLCFCGFSINFVQGNLINQTQELGYKLERHKLVTEDGYVLSLFRIPGNKHSQIITRPNPVLLFHGLVFSMNQWLVVPGQSTAYELADAGYDVWLANSRGTSYSNGHIIWSEKDPSYWNFSWHEIGYYDVPAIIDHILQQTKTKQVHFIGHSQGATVALVALSTRPEYNEKIASTYFLAPAAFLQVTKGTERLISATSELLNIGNFAMIPCKDTLIVPSCSVILAPIFGPYLNKFSAIKSTTLLSKKVADYGATKQLTHFVQNVYSKKFQQFDYGALNIQKYGTYDPPAYNLSHITVPITIRSFDQDWFAHGSAIKLLFSHLKNVNNLNIYSGNHIEFLFNSDTLRQINSDILNNLLLNKRSSRQVPIYNVNNMQTPVAFTETPRPIYTSIFPTMNPINSISMMANPTPNYIDIPATQQPNMFTSGINALGNALGLANNLQNIFQASSGQESEPTLPPNTIPNQFDGVFNYLDDTNRNRRPLTRPIQQGLSAILSGSGAQNNEMEEFMNYASQFVRPNLLMRRPLRSLRRPLIIANALLAPFV